MTIIHTVLPCYLLLRHSCVTMNKPQETFKLRVKIDGQEFEAEGRSDLVTREFEAFRLLIQGRSHATGEYRLHPEGRRPVDRPPQEATPHVADHAIDLARLFRVSPQTQVLSLHQPPQGKHPEADAVLLLLLGHRRLRNEDEVPVTVITEALKQSGCPVARLDRILTIYTKDHSVLRSGRGKGGKYRLTNLGLKKAESMVSEAG